ncbi:cytochrome c oxidase subunit VIa-domain-containing protein [Mycena floridula]|nr:cytochrome c oxidase subunit VIa-domain-containing protein [Mycena floridula]
MSFIARNSFRAAFRRPAPRIRGYATEQIPTSATSPYLAELEAVEHHAIGTTDLWRKISYFVCVPAIAVCIAWVYKVEAAHAHHTEHLKEENGGELPEIPAYDYLNRRSKPFPWGPNSLFFNPHVNKDMSE